MLCLHFFSLVERRTTLIARRPSLGDQCSGRGLPMLDADIVTDLHQKLSSGDAQEQAQSALHIRDLCAEKEEYRGSLGSVVAPLVGLLDAAPASQQLTHTAAQALAYLAECEEHRDKIRWGTASFGCLKSTDQSMALYIRQRLRRELGGVETMVSVLKALSKASVSTPQGRDLRTTLLDVLLAMAVDEPNRVAASKAGLVHLLVQMLGLKDDAVRATPSTPGPTDAVACMDERACFIWCA